MNIKRFEKIFKKRYNLGSGNLFNMSQTVALSANKR